MTWKGLWRWGRRPLGYGGGLEWATAIACGKCGNVEVYKWPLKLKNRQDFNFDVWLVAILRCGCGWSMHSLHCSFMVRCGPTWRRVGTLVAQGTRNVGDQGCKEGYSIWREGKSQICWKSLKLVLKGSDSDIFGHGGAEPKYCSGETFKFFWYEEINKETFLQTLRDLGRDLYIILFISRNIQVLWIMEN